MASITLRETKGVRLSYQEVDTNFTNINTELGNKVTSVSGTTGRIAVSGTTSPQIDLASIGSAGSANLANITIDEYGRVTSISSNTVNEYSDTKARGAISVTDNGGDGSLSYNNTSGVITYTGPSASDVRAHFSAGTGISITSGQISVDSTIATKSYADSAASTAVAAVIDTAPSTLDTLNELAAALGDDANFSTTITTSLGNKLNTSDFTSTANTWLGTKSTNNLTEGTNLYFTDARARSAISGSTGITYNNSTGAIALTSGIATAGTYQGSVTVDTYGRVTSGSNTLTGYNEGSVYDNGTITSGSLSMNASNGNAQKVTIAGSGFTLNPFTSPVAGQSISLIIYNNNNITAITQGTGTWKWSGGSKTLTGTTGTIDILFVFFDGTTYFASINKGFA